MPDFSPEEVREALEGMVRQFAYWSTGKGGYMTGGLSALEYAFDVLGWDDPHPAPEARCDEPGCMSRVEMGTPTPTGYRSTCSTHGHPLFVAYQEERRAKFEEQRTGGESSGSPENLAPPPGE